MTLTIISQPSLPKNLILESETFKTNNATVFHLYESIDSENRKKQFAKSPRCAANAKWRQCYQGTRPEEKAFC